MLALLAIPAVLVTPAWGQADGEDIGGAGSERDAGVATAFTGVLLEPRGAPLIFEAALLTRTIDYGDEVDFVLGLTGVSARLARIPLLVRGRIGLGRRIGEGPLRYASAEARWYALAAPVEAALQARADWLGLGEEADPALRSVPRVRVGTRATYPIRARLRATVIADAFVWIDGGWLDEYRVQAGPQAAFSGRLLVASYVFIRYRHERASWRAEPSVIVAAIYRFPL